MNKTAAFTQRLACLLGAGVFVLAPCGMVGCSDGGVSDTVRMPASKRPDLDPQATSGTIRIPADQAFNVVAFRSGQEGAARGEAQPQQNDGAVLEVEAKDGGTAWAEFQLGYCFDNMGDQPLKGIVRFQLDSTRIATTSKIGNAPSTAMASTASVNLTAFIKSSSGILLKEEPLAATTLLKGPCSAERPYDLVFDLDLAPMTGYYIVLTGRADVQSQVGQSASATLEVPKCSVQVRWHPRDTNSESRSRPAAATGTQADETTGTTTPDA